MRVRIASPRLADEDDWVAAVRSSRELHEPWLTLAGTSSEFAEYLARSRGDRHASYLVRRAEDAALVGFVNLSEIIRGSLQQAFLGYGAFFGFERRGYMREALSLVLGEAFGSLGLHRVEVNIQPGNLASKALVGSVGLSREGFSPRYLKVGGKWRDHERWAITAETWRARPDG